MARAGEGRARKFARRSLVIAGVVALAVPLAGTAVAATEPGTGTVAVCLTDSTGANVTLGGDQAFYQKDQYVRYVGEIGDSGCREITLPAGSDVDVWVGKDGTKSHKQTGTVVDGQTLKVDFYTTKLTIQYPGPVAFGGPAGNSKHFKTGTATESRELLSDGSTPTVFRLNQGKGPVARVGLTWPVANGPGVEAVRSLVAVQVLTGAGVGTPGATVRYQPFGNYWYHAPGKTDENGMLAWAVNGTVGNVTNEVKVNGTTKTLTHDVSTQAYNTFQTTNVTVNYTEGVRYYHNGVNATHFPKPSTELFEGTYKFDFRVPDRKFGNAGTTWAPAEITVGTTPVVKTAAVARLQESTGAGIAGGTVDYYRSGWTFGAATTGANGAAVVLFDGAAPTDVTFKTTYANGSQQLGRQNLQTSSIANFYTVPVTLRLVDHQGAPLDGGTATYYGTNGWQDFGAASGGEVTRELLPYPYSFRMGYLGSDQQISKVDVAGQPTTTFQTGAVVSESGTAKSMYTNSWRPFDNGVELLPGKVTFSFTDGTPNATLTIAAGQVNTIH